jgi:MFS family permease
MPGRGPWLLVALLSITLMVNYMDRQVVFALFPVLRREMSFSDMQLGLAGSLFTWTYSLSMPVAGRLADLFSKRRLIILSLILWSLATVGTGLSRNIGEFLASRIVMGLSESLYIPAAIALITQAHPGATRSRALSIHGFAQFTGITLGGWYGGWSAEQIGWRTGLFTLAIAGIAWSGVLLRFLRADEAPAVEVKSEQASPKELFYTANFWAMSVTFFAFCAMLWMLYAWLPSYIYETYRLSLAESGLAATLYLQSSSAVGVLLGGYLGDRFGRRQPVGRFRVLTIGLFCCAPFAVAAFGAGSLTLLKISACGFGLFAGLFVANIFSGLYDVVARRNFGFATGLVNMIGGLGAGAAILLTGMLKQSMSISSLMMFGATAAMIMSVVLLIVISRFFQKRTEQALPGGPPAIDAESVAVDH